MTRKRKGIALALVMVTLGLTVTLTGAFLGINHSNFALVRAAGGQERAHQACLSAYAYAMLRLEHDRAWGAVPFDGNSDPWVAAHLQLTEVASSNRCTGEIPGLEQSFEIEVINRLSQDTPHPSENCPARSVLLKIVGRAHGFQRRMEVTLRKEPFFDSGALCNDVMQIDAEQLVVGSRDPYRSVVRSNRDIYAPDAVTNSKIIFSPKVGAPAPLDQPPHGSLWAKGGIYSGVHSLLDPAKLALAQASSNGNFVTGAPKRHSITDLDPEDMVEHGVSRSLPGGNFRFEELTQTVLENRAFVDGTGATVWSGWAPVDPPVSTPALVRRDALGQIAEIRYLNDQGFATATAPDTDPTDFVLRDPAGWNLPPGTPAPQPEGSGLATDQGVFEWPGSGVHFDLKTSTIRVPEGDVQSTEDLSFDSGPGRPLPSLILGSVNTSGPEPVPIVATIQVDGGFTVRGTVDGYGAVVASQDVSLMARSSLTSTPERGVAIFAERDVHMRPNPGVPTIGGMQSFYGLVYAQRDFLFQGDDGDPRWDLLIEGALVARDGKISIANSRSTQFVYNPAYLEQIIKNLAESRIRLESVCWRL